MHPILTAHTLWQPLSIPLVRYENFSKIQDGGGRHLGFRKMLIISAIMKQFSPNFNSKHLVAATIDSFSQICKFFKNPRWRWPPSSISRNVNNFRKDEGILTKFHQHIPGTNCRRPYWSKMQNFKNPRWRRPPSWISEKC